MKEHDETKHLLSTKANKERLLEDVFNDEKRQGVKELIDKHTLEEVEKDFSREYSNSLEDYLKEELKKYQNVEVVIMNKPKESKQETLEKYSERFDNDESEIGDPETWGKRMVVEPKQERSYSEEDMRQAFNNGAWRWRMHSKVDIFKEWLKTHKKK